MDGAILGAATAAILAAVGALVGYGSLKQKVTALEVWRVRQEVVDTKRDEELTRLLQATARNTANIEALTDNLNRLLTIHPPQSRSKA